MDKKKFIRKIREIISIFVSDSLPKCKFDGIEIAYLFGSFLEYDEFNDIDIAIFLSKELNPYERFKFAMKLARELEKGIKPRFEFDVKILNYSPIEFQYEVVKKGKVVFLRDETKRIEYESKLILTYLDFKWMYEFLDNEFLARV